MWWKWIFECDDFNFENQHNKFAVFFTLQIVFVIERIILWYAQYRATLEITQKMNTCFIYFSLFFFFPFEKQFPVTFGVLLAIRVFLVHFILFYLVRPTAWEWNRKNGIGTQTDWYAKIYCIFNMTFYHGLTSDKFSVEFMSSLLWYVNITFVRTLKWFIYIISKKETTTRPSGQAKQSWHIHAFKMKWNEMKRKRRRRRRKKIVI